MKMMILSLVFFLGLGRELIAQVTTGTIKGKIFDTDTSATIPGVRVWVETDGGVVGVMSDPDGRFNIVGLKPGIYSVKAKPSGYEEITYLAVQVNPDADTHVDFTFSKTLGVIDVIWTEPLIDKNIVRVRILSEDIKVSPYIRSPLELLNAATSDIQLVEGTNEIIIRGSRPGDAVYFIDGVKTTDLTPLPGVAIGSMEAYTGGIPAKYGDTTGGVVILESKSYFDLYNAWLARQ